jgi:hypothetical protein
MKNFIIPLKSPGFLTVIKVCSRKWLVCACNIGWWKDNKGVTGRKTKKWKRKKKRWT